VLIIVRVIVRVIGDKHEKRRAELLAKESAKGLSARKIQATFLEMHDAEASPDLISKVTDGVVDKVIQWQSRPLEAVYPIIYLNGITDWMQTSKV